MYAVPRIPCPQNSTAPSLFFLRKSELLAGLSISHSESENKQGLSIIFVDEYGRESLQRFCLLKKRYPVLNKCSHEINTSSFNGFIELSNMEAIEICLSRCASSDTVIIAADMGKKSNRVVVETLAAILAGRCLHLICVTPVTEGNLTNFRLVLTSSPEQGDITPELLLTLHNTFLGCGMLGNLMCMKLCLDDIRRMNLDDNVLSCKSFCVAKTAGGYDIPALGAPATPGLSWIIVEGPLKEDLNFFLNISDKITIYVGDLPYNLVLMHAGLPTDEIRVTTLAARG